MTPFEGRPAAAVLVGYPALRLPVLAGRIRALSGWRRRLAALGAGAVSVLAMAPFFLSPVLFLTLPVLLWLIDAETADGSEKAGARPLIHRTIAAGEVGWWFGFGFHLTGLYWIGAAFLVEADKFAVLLPVAVTLMPAGLALFHACAAAGTSLVQGPALKRVLGLAVALSATEWLRGHIFTGFPWNVLGYALTFPLELAQSAAVLGIYGLTLFAVLIFAAPLVLLAEPALQHPIRRRLLALGIAAVPLGVAWVYGAARLAEPEPPPVPGVMLRLVQPSIPQHEKWRADKQREFFAAHLELSATGPDGRHDDLAGITHVIWPEAAMPFMPLDHPEALTAIANLLPPETQLIAGALRIDEDPQVSVGFRAYNSLIAFDTDGSVVALYDKIHLVPFGEYLPFQATLEALGLEQLARMRGGFTKGPAPRPLLAVPGLPRITGLICYEAVFPAAVIQGADRPGLLVNLTNDGWFGVTTGPHQHFHQARMRTIEEGLPLVRAANNGISAVVDARGRVLMQLDINIRGVIDTTLPASRARPPYALYGDGAFLLLWLAALSTLCFRWR
jgi:apolipoprotein N-acyltransferase